ncbi:MAG: electron transfer flavoprotein subunit alpha/FixB family protein, partial [Candidatus Heimdallarchaeota archaeon]|nr:electron transfer flavoprotein subunit alpha/FixB family protein [Candidatus Heimdallarchaeota archaeon]
MSIAIYLESYNGEIVKAAKEAITVAKALAVQTGKEIFGVAIDDNIDSVVDIAGKMGLNTVKGASGITLYHPTMYSRMIVNAAKDADIIIFPATVWGREISPQVCVKLDATPLSDIIEVIDGNTFKRSIHGNKIHSTIKAEGKMVITVRAAVFDVPELGAGTANLEDITTDTVDGDSVMKLAEILASSTETIELTEADIIVSGGRGIGGPENFHLIEDLAKELGAAVGASRAVV